MPRLLAELRGILVVLNSDRTLQSILDYLVAEARDLLDAQACVLYRCDREAESLIVEARAGLPTSFPSMTELPLEPGGGLGNALLNGLVLNETPVGHPDLDTPEVASALEDAGVSSAVRAWFEALVASYKASLSIPLLIKESHYGSLCFYYTKPRVLSPHDMSVAVTFGSQAALAIENARLRLQAEQAAILQERSRLARDLHDSVTQSLYSLTLLAEAARRLAGAGDLPQVEQAITRLGDIGQQALKEMRLLVYELRPSVLRREGLVRALGHRLETVERRAGIEAHLIVEGQLALSPALEEQLYHLAQEALNNALKHAAATTVTVRIQELGGELRLSVSDNGRGFDPDRSEEGGIGLVSMRERVDRLGGHLTISTGAGQGTTVAVTLTPVASPLRGEIERGGVW